jgi:hypothetical protein
MRSSSDAFACSGVGLSSAERSSRLWAMAIEGTEAENAAEVAMAATEFLSQDLRFSKIRSGIQIVQGQLWLQWRTLVGAGGCLTRLRLSCCCCCCGCFSPRVVMVSPSPRPHAQARTPPGEGESESESRARATAGKALMVVVRRCGCQGNTRIRTTLGHSEEDEEEALTTGTGGVGTP